MNATSMELESDRVRRHTPAKTQMDIDARMEQNVRYYATQSAAAITDRIHELEREWSMERWLETNASSLAFAGVVLGLTVSRKWLFLPLLVTGFLFQHAVQGWCPPLPVLRKLGVRTRSEIDREKMALKTLRGDFRDIDVELAEPPQHIKKILDAVAVA